MGRAAMDYFKNIFTSVPSVDPSPIINLVQSVIDEDTNASLCADFTEKEISDALFQIGPLKALGPDGFLARFFQRNWGTIKESIVAAVQEFLRSGVMPAEVNNTNIVLIPKI